MIDRTRILRAVATLIIAGSAGYTMQNGDALAARFGSDPVQATIVSIPVVQPKIAAFFPEPPLESVVPFDVLLPVPQAVSRVTAVNLSINADLQSDVATPFFLPESCELALTALPEAGALVRLKLNAPCYQNQRITVSHAGLEFTDVTGSDGSFTVDFPALNEFLPYEIVFSDGRSVEAKTLMLTLNGYERVAIGWSGQPGIHIHAFENNAEFGTDGHVWAEAARDADAGVQAVGGFLIQLGNPDVFQPKLAEVYSYPFERVADDTGVELLIEAEVSLDTCGAIIDARSFQLNGTGELTSTGVALTMPQCGGENGYLVLNNLFQDLKIAQN